MNAPVGGWVGGGERWGAPAGEAELVTGGCDALRRWLSHCDDGFCERVVESPRALGADFGGSSVSASIALLDAILSGLLAGGGAAVIGRDGQMKLVVTVVKTLLAYARNYFCAQVAIGQSLYPGIRVLAR